MIERRKLGLIVLLLFSFFIFINIIEPSIISKFVFTMKAVSNSFSVSLTINSGRAPNITIYEPKSRIYGHGKNMMLGYSVVDDGAVNSIWFNLNNGSNTTLNVNEYIYYFNATLGNNTLYIFANDTQGNLNNTVFVNFTIGKYDGNNYEINDSGGFSFDDDTVEEYFKSITGLNSSWTLNTTIYGNNTPSDWIRPDIVSNEVLYFEMSANTFGDTSGSYNLYFNLSRAMMGEIDPDNIRIYFYSNNWNELTTTIESSNTNAVEFKASLTHLSQFMIGEKKSSSSGGSGVTGQTGRGIRGSTPNLEKEKTPEKPEEI
ncbi:MAG: PGF-pre-PGF domain-containing protein, partial [Nanoarchaeota archaeon]